MRRLVRRKSARSSLSALPLLLCQSTLSHAAVPVAALPPPPAALEAASDAVLYLDLTVNGVAAGNVIRVVQRGDDLRIRASDLRAVGVDVPGEEEWLSLARTPEVQYSYDVNALTLEVSVPPHWLEAQYFGENGQRPMQSVSSAGVLLNYAANFVDGENWGTASSLWAELRAFGGAGVFSHTGIARRSTGSGMSRAFDERRYIRFDTSWTSSDENEMVTWTVGDLVTASQTWSSPVRVAGVRLARDFRLRPDLITYPLPQFAGEAAVPTTLDLLINGRRVRSEELRPGPYTITTMPFITGAGEATLVTTDATGRQVTATLPFYASSELLRAGLVDYAVSVGSIRQNYGLENFAYGGMVGAGSLRYGLSNSVTLEGQAEAASVSTGTFRLAGVGALATLGAKGIVNGSLSRSVSGIGAGWQYTFGYRYARSNFNFGYQGTRVSRGFRTLAAADQATSIVSGANSDVATAGVSWGSHGSVNLSYLRVAPLASDRSRFLNLSYSRQLAGAMSLTLYASHDLERDETSATAQVMASFGSRGTIRVGTEYRDGDRDMFQYSRSTPAYGGFGWNFTHVRDENNQSATDATLAWSGPYARLEAGLSEHERGEVRWGDVRGSLLAMGGDVFASQHVHDAFVVIAADGLPNVPVRYENQLVGRTNRRGRLLVPSVTSHYGGKFSIDPLGLPPEVTLAEADQRVVVKRNSGAFLKFDVAHTRPVLIKLIDAAGVALPLGSMAVDAHTGQSGAVGYDGLVYFENLDAQVTLEVQLAGGGSCRVSLTIPERATGLEPIGPVHCGQVL